MQIRGKGRQYLNLFSENDYKTIKNALDAQRERTLTRTLGDYKISAEVTPAPKVWGIPMLIQVKQWYRNVYSIKNCATVEEMRWYLSKCAPPTR